MSFIKLNIKTRVRFAAGSFIERVFYAIFSNLHIKDMFFTNKINFGNLGNFVTVGDTNCHFSQVKLQLKVNCPEIWQITENTTG
jgi:hypothetical protein